MRARPLAGVRVLDLSRLLPGPYASRVLAELGADVVKVEPPDGGDYTRWFPPLTGDPPTSAIFRELNRGKRGIVLDLRQDQDRGTLQKLSAKADVLLDGFRPGVLARLGVDPRALMADNPRLIYCALTGFGLTGPDADRAGHDLGYLARTGAIALNRHAPIGVQVADVGGSWIAIAGICAALFERERTGRGTVVDVSLVEVGLSFGVLGFGHHHAVREGLPGEPVLDGSRPCYGVYRAKDGRFIALGALEPKFWSAFVSAIDLPHLAASGLAVGEEAALVRTEVEAKLKEKTRDEWIEILRAADCCAEPVLELDEVEQDPHLRARGVSEKDALGRPVMVRAPLHLGGWSDLEDGEATSLEEAPALGADTAEVLRDWGAQP